MKELLYRRLLLSVLLCLGIHSAVASKLDAPEIEKQGPWRLATIQRMMDGGSWSYTFVLPDKQGIAVLPLDGIENSFPPRKIELFRTDKQLKLIPSTETDIPAGSKLEKIILQKLAEAHKRATRFREQDRLTDLIWLFKNREKWRPNWKMNGFSERYPE